MKRLAKVFTTVVTVRRAASLVCVVSLLVSVASLRLTSVSAALPDGAADTSLVQRDATAKRPITHQDYDSWRSIQAPQISRDGKFVAYAFLPQDGDGDVIVRNIASGVDWKAPRGYRPPVPPPDDPGANIGEFVAAQARLVRPVFTADSKFLVFSIEPAKAEVNKAKKEKKKPEEMPKNAMGIMNLSNGTVTRIEKVKNFQVPEDGSGFIAYLMEAKPEEKPAPREASSAPGTAQPPTSGANSGSPATGAQGGEGNRPAGGRPPKKKEYGADLILRNMSAGTQVTFSDVLDYSLTKDANTLVFAVSSKNEDTNGVYAVNTRADGSRVELLRGKGKYQKLTWDEDNNQLAFIADKDDAAAKQPKFRVYYWSRTPTPQAAAIEVASSVSPGLRKEFVISERANLGFSVDGSRLFFGTAPPPEPEKNPDEEIPADEKVLVDLWHWKDDYVQPIQKVRAEQERNRSYRAVYDIESKKVVQLADESMDSVSPSNDGRLAIGSDNRRYRVMADYDPGFNDFYLVNTRDGSRKLIAEKQRSNYSISPNGKYALFFDGKDWNSYSINAGRVVNLTRALPVAFFNEENDTPSIPGSYGVAGWTKDDRDVLIYDRFDVWQVAPDGSVAKNLTDGVGRKEKIAFRYVRLDPKERSIDPAKPLLLHADDEDTRDSGFYRDRIGGGLPEKLLMGAKDYNNPTKARDADVLMLSASRYDEFPDLWVGNTNFKDLKKVSDGDAQRIKFKWGTAELVAFKSTDGVALKGILLKPDNFDPKRKYPMLVYIYERLTQGLHSFRNPGPGTSINPTFYVSNDYLVFMPDISYTVGYPGPSALKCVLPAVQAVVDKGFVDEKAIGIQGHSWGGYQIAYMVTQTNRFRAAAPGALVSNMTSAYSGIRWGTGLPRQFQYERTQSRIGGSLWDYPLRFLDNSPVFRADRVQTPLLMIHNDEDDAVPWYQGIEFYLALRRLGKEAYLFSYNGEKHGLRKRINQKDYTRRLQEFFDHFLKGAPAPEWMEKGIPYLQREKEKEKYRATDTP
ncbi:MAG TPA: prolyl oligopeptidase family serine peptidase [Pyrinomonadaceae bacterium]|nr:prolyl oligopeptidase family serine peptidase [Pyrinomonadaceae bacterium]